MAEEQQPALMCALPACAAALLWCVIEGCLCVWLLLMELEGCQHVCVIDLECVW